MKRRRLMIVAMLAFFALAGHQGCLTVDPDYPAPELVPTVELTDSRVDEPSGLVQGSLDSEVFWTHNDSGGVPRIFAFRRGIIEPKSFLLNGAKCVDWEDIARWKDRLYVSDMGNNFNTRQDLGVYEVVEPSLVNSPEEVTSRFIPVAYPDQTGFPPSDPWKFDCEATFCWDGQLYFVTKDRAPFRLWVQDGGCHLYRLDSMDSDSTNVLTLVDAKADLGGWVTAADSSPDGRYVAVVCESPVQSVWLFEQPPKGDRFFSDSKRVQRFVFKEGDQVEALAFAGNEVIILLNEDGAVFEVPLSRFKDVGSS